jgi:menaquinone-dependent protoporphyrinogen oxidase
MPSRVLVVYATTEGQTARIAQALADTMRARGSAVDVCEAGSSAPAPDGYDGVIVAASVHAGSYQEPVRAWAQKHHRRLQDTPSAFVSVCLAVMQHDEKTRRDLDRIHDGFVRATGWRPGIVKEVAGALPYTRYGWLKRLIMKRIVGKAGGDTDTSRDYEYTDWDDVRRFAGEFADLTARPRRGQPS